MNSINLQSVIPNIFGQQPPKDSDLWNREVSFLKGNYYLIEAASGKGKTSFCSYAYGSRSDYQGDILFDNINLRQITPSQWSDLRRSSLSIIFQGLKLFPELTAMENIQLKNRLTNHKSDKWIRQAFEKIAIADKIDTAVAKISFGQQQRVALIRGLCQPIDFILLDEPVSHLDVENSRFVSELLLEEAEQQGFGIIATSIGKHIELPYHQTVRL